MSFIFASTGPAWDEAFRGALEFLARPEGTLVLGPCIGDAGRAWVEDRLLAVQGVRFGLRVETWNEWVKARAREHALASGRGFRPLNQAGKREHLRIVAANMAASGAFHHLQEIWSEERFFAGLLDCVTEARCAGLTEAAAIERVRDVLDNASARVVDARVASVGSDEMARAAYEDFWNLLLVYEQFLSGGDGHLDEASLLRLAAEGEPAGGELFLLGFDRFSVLEAELLQRRALHAEVHVPLALPFSRIETLLRENAENLDLPAELALRGLITGFAGERRLALGADPADPPTRRRLLAAHAPSEEARAVAALGRAGLDQFDELRYVAPEGYFDDRVVARPFREELGLPETFHARRALGNPVARLYFHLLEIKDKGYPLAQGLEVAQLLEFTQGRFPDLASRAARAGVRKGLADWKRKAGRDSVLQEFGAFLEELDRLLPARANAQTFARVTEEAAKIAGVALLAHPRVAASAEIERDAHAALAAVLRNAQMLASASRGDRELPFSEWIAELKVALAGSAVGEVTSFFPRVQFYRYGEWLPPAGDRTLTVALGLDASCGPRPGFQFFLEEGARRRLPELLLPTQVQAGMGFLDSMRRFAASGGTVLLSWSCHDGQGGEREPHWVTGALGLAAGTWPDLPREEKPAPFAASEKVSVGDPEIPSFSASFFELYKECPFKAFAERVLGLEDKVQEATLDLSRLEEGSFVHKALELYYGKYEGKSIVDDADRAQLLTVCVREATAKLAIEYFQGNERLLEAQLARLHALLLDFLRLDAAQYARFPFFGQPELEKQVQGRLGDKFSWKGKIDRVDYDEENQRFLVTDYKIGAAPPANSEVQELRRFQLQLYLDAVEAERPDWAAIGGTYASVTSGSRGTGLLRKEFNATKASPPGEARYYALGGANRALLDGAAFEELRARTREEALRLAERISAGEFPVRPLDEESSCGRCAVRPACRIQELRSPPREPWARPAPQELLRALEPAPAVAVEEARERLFNPEQADALARRGQLVFIEASAGTGKTTVIVERIRRFLAERAALGEPAHLAVERFRAISFTEKSAQELAARAAATLVADPAFGPRVAAQAEAQVSTIHGFCRKLISDFPLEAGVSPLAKMLDQKEAFLLRRETVEDFFLFPDEETAALLAPALAAFPRARLEAMLVRLLEGRLLYREEVEQFRAFGASLDSRVFGASLDSSAEGAASDPRTEVAPSPDRLFPEGGARETLLTLLDLADRLAVNYDQRKRGAHLLDFNDLELLALRVLDHEPARAHYHRRLELLLVDEFQDTNSLQREIFARLARPGWSNLFVVGDAKQSIYRFRAADVSVFQGLRRSAAAEGSLVTLGRNYRSRREIVEVANRITAAILPAPGDAAPDFEAVHAEAVPELPAGGRVALVEYGEADRKWTASERRAREAQLVAQLVRELRARPEPPGTIAILLRKFSGNEAYLRALTDAGISFRVGASKGFYGQSLVTDSIALLRVLYGAKNDLALLAVLRSPWGRVPDHELLAIERREPRARALWDKLREDEAPELFAWKRMAAHCSLVEILERALARYPQGRREHLQAVKLLSLVDKLEIEARPRAEILELISNWSGWEGGGAGADEAIMPEPAEAGTVRVMTVHAAKGLEFEVTILADLGGKLTPDNSALRVVRGVGIVLKPEEEDETGPNAKKHRELGRRNTERELAELKRLFYVAVTRAKREEYFFLPRSFPAVQPEKWNSCAHFLRAADLGDLVERVDGDAWGAFEISAERVGTEEPKAPAWPAVPNYSLFRTSSISEIAEYNTCPEFHRLKNIQTWDDRIVELWPKPRDAFRKQARRPGTVMDPAGKQVAKLLRSLGIERKERGIALHRVLERVRDPSQGLALAGVWLREAYEAQGVKPDAPELAELLALDLERLGHFLRSPAGQEFFNANATAFPEIPFQWKLGELVLHGAIDRLIRNPDGSWIVVDYKSSVQEQNLDDYRFQVASYMAAVREREKARTGKAPEVSGFLVDLFAGTAIPVASSHEDAVPQLRAQLARTERNYTLPDKGTRAVAPGTKAGEVCFTCPYSYHCEIGITVLRSKES